MCALTHYGRPRSSPRLNSQAPDGSGTLASNPDLLAAALDALSQSVAVIDANGCILAVNEQWRRDTDEGSLRWARGGMGHNYLSVLDHAAGNGDVAAAQVALGIRCVLAGSASSFHTEYAGPSPSGSRFLEQVTAFDFGGRCHALVARENVTLRRRHEDELRAAADAAETARQQEQARREAAEAIADLQGIANSGLPLDEALQSMVDRVGETMGSAATGLYWAEERWDRPILRAASGALRNAARNACPTVATPVLAQAIASRRSCGAANTPAAPALFMSGTHSHLRDYPALLLTPIQRRDDLMGYLVLFYAEEREFGAADLAVADLFGRQVTMALDNADLRSRAEKIAIENERSRLARELHDAVTQTLFSASVVAEALPRVWERDPATGQRALEDLRLWTRGALAELRTLLLELRPTTLSEMPLPDLIRRLGEAAEPRLNVPVVCHLTSEKEPPTEVKLCLYRVAQEALNNIAKHAHASQVEIYYRAQPEAVRLTVFDNGRGFDVDRRAAGQMGLNIMAERTRQIGARLTLHSDSGAGTEVCVEWQPKGGVSRE
jgi:signal transduction histidine kinase